MNLLDPVDVEEAMTTPEGLHCEEFPHAHSSPDLTGSTWKIQIKVIYMTDTVSFSLKKESRSTSVPGAHEDIKQ